jgi:hypothetical protein
MMRKQLTTLKALAEQAARSRSAERQEIQELIHAQPSRDRR